MEGGEEEEKEEGEEQSSRGIYGNEVLAKLPVGVRLDNRIRLKGFEVNGRGKRGKLWADRGALARVNDG